MRLTVAICTHNPNEPALVRALDSIVPQLDDAQFILVDNNSAQPLRQRAWLQTYPATLLEQPVPGLTAARETVIDAATGDVIVFVDDDNILEPGYLELVRELFRSDPDLGLLGGAVIPEYESTPPPWIGDFEDSIAIRRYTPDVRVRTTEAAWSPHLPIGAGMSVRTALARAYVADCLKTSRIQGRRGSALSSGEDLDLGLFVLSSGHAVAIDGRLRLTHLIGSGRVEGAYLERLAAGNMRSSWELEQKWSPRLGHRVFSMFDIPLPRLLAVYAALTLASPLSARWRIKRRVYSALLRARLGRPV